MTHSIDEIIGRGRDEAPAIAAVDRPALTYRGLRRQVERTVAALGSCGIGRGDPVALVLPNGPEMATAFVALAAAAVAAPLNPAYRAGEFESYLTDLQPKALLVPAGAATPARAVAARHGVRILELSVPARAAAGEFDLQTLDASGSASAPTTPSGAGDVALLLHTSGTTSRPKVVPLTQRNLCVAADHVRRALELGPADLCLNLMPLFHIHGLLAALLASLAAGAAVVCPPRVQDPALLRLARSVRADLVHGRAHDARGDPGARAAQPGDRRARAAAPWSAPPRRRCRPASWPSWSGCPRDRGLRHDRGGASDPEQSAAAAGAQARLGRRRRRA